MLQRAHYTRVGGITGGLAVGALVGLCAVAGAAPSISADERCLRPGQAPTGQLVAPALVVCGTGFTPGGRVRITRGLREVEGDADELGSFRASLSVIDLADSQVPAVRTLPVSAHDLDAAQTGAGRSNTLRVRVAPLAFSVTPERAAPTTRVLFRFSGFRPGRAIRAHYILNGRLRASRALALAGGPCGTAAIRRPQFPMARPAVGVWRVQFDQVARFSSRSRPRIIANIEVYPAE